MYRFRRKIDEIEAVQFTNADYPQIREWITGHDVLCTYKRGPVTDHLIIYGLTRCVSASLGDYVIRGDDGTFSVMYSDVFEANYELTNESNLHLE